MRVQNSARQFLSIRQSDRPATFNSIPFHKLTVCTRINIHCISQIDHSRTSLHLDQSKIRLPFFSHTCNKSHGRLAFVPGGHAPVPHLIKTRRQACNQTDRQTDRRRHPHKSNQVKVNPSQSQIQVKSSDASASAHHDHSTLGNGPIVLAVVLWHGPVGVLSVG